jgi:hypothetical protein
MPSHAGPVPTRVLPGPCAFAHPRPLRPTRRSRPARRRERLPPQRLPPLRPGLVGLPPAAANPLHDENASHADPNGNRVAVSSHPARPCPPAVHGRALLARFQEQHGCSEPQVAAHLGLPPGQLPRLALCFKPPPRAPTGGRLAFCNCGLPSLRFAPLRISVFTDSKVCAPTTQGRTPGSTSGWLKNRGPLRNDRPECGPHLPVQTRWPSWNKACRRSSGAGTPSPNCRCAGKPPPPHTFFYSQRNAEYPFYG